MNRLVKTSVICLALSAAPSAFAQGMTVIYKHVDDRGKVTYANSPIKGGVKVDLEPITIISASPSGSLHAQAAAAALNVATVTPTARAKPASVDTAPPKRQEETASRRLEEQLATEEKLLNDARARLEAEQRENDTVRALRSSGGSDAGGRAQKPVLTTEVRQSVERYFERVRNLQDQIAMLEISTERLRDRLRVLTTASN